MALVHCPECKKEVSNQATACLHCGYPLRAAVPTTSAAKGRKRGTGRLWLLLAVAVFLFVLVLSQRGREPKVETKEDVQLWTMTATAMQIRKGMRNPESFVLESVLLIQGTDAVCFEYRAQNGFGGMNRGRAVVSGARFVPGFDGQAVLAQAQLKTSDESGFIRLWNKECANKTGVEKGSLVRRAMDMARK